MIMYFLRELGAKVVGVPSGQAPNAPMEITPFVLPRSRLEGGISNSAQVFLPEAPRADTFPVDFPLTLKLAAKYRFERNAAAHYAVDLLTSGALKPRPSSPPGRK
jgi:hypothetical protein